MAVFLVPCYISCLLRQVSATTLRYVVNETVEIVTTFPESTDDKTMETRIGTEAANQWTCLAPGSAMKISVELGEFPLVLPLRPAAL